MDHPNKTIKSLVGIIIILTIIVPFSTAAEIYLQDDFEDGSFDVGSANPQPIWYWPDNDNTGGPNAWWKISDTSAHASNYSIKLDYLARNGFANHCGIKTTYQKNGYNDTYLVEFDGKDFTDPANGYVGSGNIVGRYVWDETKNFTKWQVIGVSTTNSPNDTLNLTLIAPGPNYDETVTIESGDECKVARECGVDGSICISSGDICLRRRNDCNGHIIYLQGYNNSTFPYGTIIYRRFYLKFSADYIRPISTQKIAYAGTIGIPGNSMWGTCTVLGSGTKALATGNHLGWNSYDGYPLPIELEQWYYFEDMHKSESALGAGNGEYKAWFAKAGENPGEPKLHLQNITFPPLGTNIGGMSIWGNKQTYEDMQGYAYVDDIVISSDRIGPTESIVQPPTKYGLFDFANLYQKWHTSDSTYDLNSDGIVNVGDLAIMMRNFL